MVQVGRSSSRNNELNLARLQLLLDKSDYKILKSIEKLLLANGLITESIIEERETIRSKIRAIEAEKANTDVEEAIKETEVHVTKVFEATRKEAKEKVEPNTGPLLLPEKPVAEVASEE